MKRKYWAAATACVAMTLGTSSAPASEQTDAEAFIAKWIGDFNRGDFKAFAAACAPQTAVTDGFPPYAWVTCAGWMRDYKVNNKAIGATHGVLKTGKLSWSEIRADRAYFVFPVTFEDTQQGKPVSYTGSWAITLRKSGGRWAVTGSGSAWGATSL